MACVDVEWLKWLMEEVLPDTSSLLSALPLELFFFRRKPAGFGGTGAAPTKPLS
jgi:hypothetical protein